MSSSFVLLDQPETSAEKTASLSYPTTYPAINKLEVVLFKPVRNTRICAVCSLGAVDINRNCRFATVYRIVQLTGKPVSSVAEGGIPSVTFESNTVLYLKYG
jgi:hypothetical protein